jgi:NNP family nitrate/nitrite transporter-like MFS transporter
MAAGLYLPSGIATLTAVVSSRHWGKAIAIHELAPNLSFVAAPLLSEIVLIWFSWRAVLVLLGVAAMLNAMFFARFGRGGDFKGVTPSLSSFRPFLVEPAFWIMLLLFSLGISGSLAVYTMLPLYLITEHGLDRNLTNTLVAISRISGIVMAFAGGWVTDRFGPKKTLVSVFLLTGATTVLLGAVSSSWVLVIVFLQPMLAVCFFPAGFASLSRIGPSNSRNLAVSLTIPFAFLIGGGAIPAGIGFMGDAVSFALGIVMVGGLILCGAGLACFLRFQEKRAPSP